MVIGLTGYAKDGN